MLNIERYNLILQMLEERRSIRLQDIVEKLNISEATVRRDLNFLEKSGKLKRVRGGATFIVINSAKGTAKNKPLTFHR